MKGSSRQLRSGGSGSSTNAQIQGGKRKLNTREGPSNTTSEQHSSQDRITLGVNEAELQEIIDAAVAQALSANRNANALNKKKKGCTYIDFVSCKPPIFDGEKGAIAAYTWLQNMESVLELSDCADDKKVMYATHDSFKSEARLWWDIICDSKGKTEIKNLTWDKFKELMLERFCCSYELGKVDEEFMSLEMRNKSLREYTTKFNEMACFIPRLATPETRKINRYRWGLPYEIGKFLLVREPKTFEEAVSTGSKMEAMVSRQADEVQEEVKRR